MLVTFCASHIDTSKRLDYFRCMLKSWNEQTLKTKMILVLSASDDELLNLATSSANMYQDITVVHGGGSQFEKYKKAVESYEGNDWILFTDDDDLWSHERAEEFSKAISSAGYDVDAIRIRRVAMNFSTGETQTFKTEKEIDEAVEVNHLHIKEDKTLYPMYAARVSVLKEFVEKANVAHKYADSAWCRFLGTKQTVDAESKSWMYFFRLHSDQICMKVRHSELVEKNVEGLDVSVFERMTRLSNAKESLMTPLHYMFDRLDVVISNNGFEATDQLRTLDESFKMFYKIRSSDTPSQEVVGMSSIVRLCIWPFVEKLVRDNQAYFRSLDVC